MRTRRRTSASGCANSCRSACGRCWSPSPSDDRQDTTMKGDFSRWAFDPVANFSGVLYQQGRVRTDVDDNAATAIGAHWRETAARDVIGAGIAAAPADAGGGFKVVSAKVVAGSVAVRLD